jgi:transcriptional regulator, lysR family
MLAQAAIERLGVALIPPFLIQQELTNGSLISPCPQSMPSSRAYYLIVPEHKAERPALTCFREWLVGEAKANSQIGGTIEKAEALPLDPFPNHHPKSP